MTKKDCTNTGILWSCETGDVVLFECPVPNGRRLPSKYDNYSSGLACYTAFQRASFEDRKKMVFIEFAHLVVGDGIDPVKLHHILLELEEYRSGCSDDMPGAFKARQRHGEE